MKKIIFLIFGIIYSFTCIGQRMITLSDLVSLNLPEKAEKVSRDQALSHVAKKFNNDKIAVEAISLKNSGHIFYKINDILISLLAHDGKIKEGHWLEIKKGFDELYKGDSTYTASLKSVNNNSVLVINYIKGNIEYYHFFCNNANTSGSVTGGIEFNKTNAIEATNILDNILKSIKFKD